ncbi:MAG: hypothetical protein WC867_01880 [Candidatus Pacearchaeota archaeon]|jgi:hypothetical protein
MTQRINSLEEAIKIFSKEIKQKIEMGLKEPFELDEIKGNKVYGANLYNSFTKRLIGAIVYIQGSDSIINACSYRGDHPYLNEQDQEYDDEIKRTILILSFEKFGENYKRGDRNQIPFLGVNPVNEQNDPVIFLDIEKFLKREELNYK